MIRLHDVEIAAGCLQHVGEIARQNALLTGYRSQRLAGRTHIESIPIRDLELQAIVTQQHLLRGLDQLLPLLIAIAA